MVSGVELLLDVPSSARYPTLEHTAPSTGQSGWLVVAAAINDMKSDFALDEFMKAIPLLAQVFANHQDKKATSDLQLVLDSLKHFRRVKATDSLTPR